MAHEGLTLAREVRTGVVGCPKCGSQAWNGIECVICGHAASPGRDEGHRVQDLVRPAGGDPGLRRLDAAWAERDRQLDGDGREGVGPEAKTYTCRECGETFPTTQALAGHANTHRRSSDGPRAGKPRPGHQRADGKAPPAAQPARKPPDEHGVPCPLCCQSLPASVGILIQQFEREAVDEDLATRLAAKAYGLLHIPS